MAEMTPPQPPGTFEFWKDDGQGVLKMRCACWRYFINNGIADNNGWWPRTNYPHSPFCEHRKV
jgi:hypothetical protein